MRGFGTCYQRGRYWWIQFWRRGRRQRESTGSIKFKDAQELLRRRLSEEQAKLHAGQRELTVGDLYEALERDYVINRHKSLRNVKQVWANHLKASFASVPAHLLSPQEVTIYIAARQAQGAKNGTINRELAALKRMFKLALKAAQIKTVPYVPTLQERNVRKGFVKDAQYEALARETGRIGLWLRAMFEVAYTYGWRKSELLELRVRQVDLVERTIDLDPGETKNDEGRNVELTDHIYELVRQCIAGKGPDDHVFSRERDLTGRKARSHRIVDFRDAWEQACVRAGCQGLLFHDLRRSGVRNMRRNGISEKVAMTISGHKTRSVFERYNIIDRDDIRDAVKKLDRADRSRRQRELFDQGEMFEAQPPRKPAVSEGLSEPENRHKTATNRPN